MATAILPEQGAPAAPPPAAAPRALPDPRTRKELDALLRSLHVIVRTGRPAWLQTKRRSYGGPPQASELEPFTNEQPLPYAKRQAKTTIIPFGKVYAAENAGHLAREFPVPNYGTLGEVRERERIDGPPSRAEEIHYNVNGPGGDGVAWPTFWTHVTEDIHDAGFGWIYTEAPDLSAIRRRQRASGGTGITLADVRAGLRPYLVYFPATHVQNFGYSDETLDWAVCRIPMRAVRFEGGELTGNDGGMGYLLLVRQGFDGFGEDFVRGGWWKFDAEMQPLGTGDWSRTHGEIPMVRYFYERSNGIDIPDGALPTTGEWLMGALAGSAVPGQMGVPLTSYPAMARSGTFELGNVSVALMDAISERDSDAREAAASELTVAGVDPIARRRDGSPAQIGDAPETLSNNFNDYALSKAARSRINPIPVTIVETGIGADMKPTRSVVIPTVSDSSMGAVPAEVYEKIIASKFIEAKEIMTRELTSAPDASGKSKQVGFVAGKSPRLALLATNCESAMNASIRWLELRGGAAEPRGFVTLAKDYDLTSALDALERAILRERDSGIRSATFAVEANMQALDEDGLIPDDALRAKIRGEWEASSGAPRPNLADERALLDAEGALSPLDTALGTADPASDPAAVAAPSSAAAPVTVADVPAPAPAPVAVAAPAPEPIDAAALAQAVVAGVMGQLAPRLDQLERDVEALRTVPVPPPAPPGPRDVTVRLVRDTPAAA